MTFHFDCRKCSHSNEAEWSWVGKTIACEGCGETILVPAPMESVKRVEDSPAAPRSIDRFRFGCQECGRKYSSRPDLIGKKIRCGGCGARVKVPDPGSVSSSSSGRIPTVVESRALSRASSTELEARAPRVSKRLEPAPKPPRLFESDEFPAISRDDVPSKSDDAEDSGLSLEPPTLPKPRSRKSKTKDGEIVDRVLPSRSEKMAEVEERMAEEAEAKLKRERKKKKKFSKTLAGKHIGGGMIMQDVVNILGASCVSIALISLICWRFPDSRFMIGGGLTVFGFIVYLLGTAGFSKVAREEGFHYSLMCRFVPLYKWYYLWTRWDEMKGHFVFFCAGLMFLWPGLFILKISPEGMKADAAEKAYTDRHQEKAPQPPPPVILRDLD